MVEEKVEGEISIRYSDDDIVSESKATAKAIGAMGDSIESDLDDVSDSADKVQKEFEKVGKSAKSGGDKAGKALDQTGEKAKKAATKLKETGSAGKKAGDDVAAGANKGARAMEQMATSADNADNSMETLSTSMIGLAQTATGVSDAIFGLSASLVGLEKTKFGIKGMEIAARRMEEDLVVAFQEGILTTKELDRLTEDLGLAYEGLSLEFKQAAADELALNGQLVTLAINTGAAVFQSVIMIKTLTTMKGVRAAVTATTVADSTATVTNTAVTTGNIAGRIANTAATIGHTVATVASTVATRAMTVAMLLSPLAPFAIAAIAAGAAFIALNDNIGGTRDRIEDLTGQNRGSIPTLGFSISGLGDKFEDTTKKGVDFQGQAQAIADSAIADGGFIPVIEDATDNVQFFNSVLNPEGTGALSAFGDSLGAATEKLIPFATGIFDASGNLIDMSKHIGNNNIALDAWGRAILDSSGKLATETNLLAVNTNALKENSKAIDENLKKKLIQDEIIKRRSIILARLQRGGNVDFAIQRFLETSNNNFADPNFIGGGFSQSQLGLGRAFELTSGLIGSDPFGVGGSTQTTGPGIPMSTLVKQAQRRAFAHSVEGVAVIALSNVGRKPVKGGFKANVLAGTGIMALDRTQAKIAQTMNISVTLGPIIQAHTNGLFPFNPITFLTEGNSLGELHAIAIKLNEGESIRIAIEATAVITARAESVSLLAIRLGTSQERIKEFTQTDIALQGFIDPALAATTGLSRQQIQDFLSTESGRRDLANLIARAQRDELIRISP